MTNVKVLYEDNHLIAVYKPAGVLSQPDVSHDLSIFEEVKLYLKEKYQKPGKVFLGLLHRLDRPVSGIILFAKTSKGASRLSEQFRNRVIEKKYQALVIGQPKAKQGTLIHRLGKDEKLKKAKPYADGKEVRLDYKVLKSNSKYSLLEIMINTGTFHQIRAQLSLAGLPIIGDLKYGAPPLPVSLRCDGVGASKEPLPDPPSPKASAFAKASADKSEGHSKSIALCATGLSFYCATEDKKIALTLPTPKDWLMYLFNT